MKFLFIYIFEIFNVSFFQIKRSEKYLRKKRSTPNFVGIPKIRKNRNNLHSKPGKFIPLSSAIKLKTNFVRKSKENDSENEKKISSSNIVQSGVYAYEDNLSLLPIQLSSMTTSLSNTDSSSSMMTNDMMNELEFYRKIYASNIHLLPNSQSLSATQIQAENTTIDRVQELFNRLSYFQSSFMLSTDLIFQSQYLQPLCYQFLTQFQHYHQMQIVANSRLMYLKQQLQSNAYDDVSIFSQLAEVSNDVQKFEKLCQRIQIAYSWIQCYFRDHNVLQEQKQQNINNVGNGGSVGALDYNLWQIPANVLHPSMFDQQYPQRQQYKYQ